MGVNGWDKPRHRLIRSVMEYAELDEKTARLVVNTVLGSMRDALKRNEKVEVRGFGTFTRYKRKGSWHNFVAPTAGTNRFTGRASYPDKWTVRFRTAKELQYIIDKGYDESD